MHRCMLTSEKISGRPIDPFMERCAEVCKRKVLRRWQTAGSWDGWLEKQEDLFAGLFRILCEVIRLGTHYREEKLFLCSSINVGKRCTDILRIQGNMFYLFIYSYIHSFIFYQAFAYISCLKIDLLNLRENCGVTVCEQINFNWITSSNLLRLLSLVYKLSLFYDRLIDFNGMSTRLELF